MPRLKQRIRKHHQKTRSGCQACRACRVKCSEEKPACGRCSKSGRECVYNAPKTWFFEPSCFDRGPSSPSSKSKTTISERAQTLKKLERQHLVPCRHKPKEWRLEFYPIPAPISETISSDPEESRAFQMYVCRCRYVCEVVEESDMMLFTDIIPQMSHDIPAVKWGMLCIASCFASMADPARAAKYHIFCERQYLKIIHFMTQKRSSTLSRSAALIVCILLVSIEAHRHDQARLFVHFKSAVAILQENDSADQPEHIDKSLRQIIERFGARLSVLTGNDIDPLQSTVKTSLFYTCSLVDFYRLIYHICRRLTRDMFKPSLERSIIQRQCIDLLVPYWNPKQQDISLKGHKHGTSRQVYLRIQHHICRLVLSNLHKARATMFEESEETLRLILRECRQFSNMKSGGSNSSTDSKERTIRLGYCLELIQCVFFVASECHDLTIRQEAITFLRHCCRREKFWDSYHAATIAEWLLAEEHKQRELLATAGTTQCNQLMISSMELYQDTGGLGHAFRRPAWARIEYYRDSILEHHWLLMHEDKQQRELQGTTDAAKPKDVAPCYQLDFPVWPSTARMIWQAYDSGKSKN